MNSRILIAYPRDAERRAREVAVQLRALGYEVGALEPRQHKAGRERVVMLWSREAWGTPALRAAAQQAHARGRLVCVRLDRAPPPVRGARLMTLPGGDRDWRRALSASPRPIRAKASERATAQKPQQRRPRRTESTPVTASSKKEVNSRSFAVGLTLVLLGVAATAYAYTVNAAVAAQIDTAAANVYAEASKLAALAP